MCCLSSCFFHAVLVLVPAQVAITSLLAYFFDDVVLVLVPEFITLMRSHMYLFNV